MGLSANLEALIKKYNISQNQLAISIGVSAATVSRWISSNMGIRASSVRQICDVYGLVPDDILSDTHGLANKVDGDGVVRPGVPLVSARAVGEYLDAAKGDFALGRVEVTSSIAEKHPRAFALPVEDKAMNLVIPASSYAIVDPDMEPANLSTVAVEVEEIPGATLRRMLKGKSTMVLTSESTDSYDDIVATEGGRHVRVLGTVVWYQPARPLA